MAQISLTQHVCSQCGTAIDTNPRFCPNCGVQMDAEPSHSSGKHTSLYALDPEATQRVSYRPPFNLYTGEENDSTETDATRRVSARLSSRIYGQAAQQEAFHLSAVRKPTGHDVQVSQDSRQLLASMRSKRRPGRKMLVQVVCAVGLFLLLSLLVFGVTGYSGDTSARRQVAQNKAQLDRLLQQAHVVGVPLSLLQPILKQEQQLSSSTTPVTFFHHLFARGDDQNLAKRYQDLGKQVPAVIATATEQAQLQAQQDMQNFQTALSRGTMQGLGNIHLFSQQFSADQLLLQSAKYPKDYVTISNDAHQALLTLDAMEVTFRQLADFQTTIARLKATGLDGTAMQAEYQNDLQMFNMAVRMLDFKNLSTQINAQYQQIVVTSVQSFPYVSVTKLNELEEQVRLLKTYGVDASYYQARLNDDQVAVEHTKTVYDDLLFIQHIDADIASMHDKLVQGEARYLVKQFHQEVDAWAKAHLYHDSYDGHDYALDNGYMHNGIGTGLDSDLATAGTTAALEAIVDEAKNALFNLHMLEADYRNQTPYNQVHSTDLQLIDHYNLQQKQVLMVSLVGQAMRVYQNGSLAASFHVTTGRQELPSLPGVWTVLDRKSPIIFKAAEPRGSPYWFPDTPISYAILYHWGGYFVHDAPWRANFGPGTQFPHSDSSGTTAYNFDGSHGCINLSESDAAWVYKHTDWNTVIVIY